jgi:hypothetical protein
MQKRMSDTPRYIICHELYDLMRREYYGRTHSEYTSTLWFNYEWSKFLEQQNLGVAVPSDSTFIHIKAAFQVVDPKQFLMTSIRLGLQYEDVPTTPLQVTQ